MSPPDSSRSLPDSSRHHLNRSSVARSTTAGCFCQCRMWELELGLAGAGESGHRGRAPSSADSRALPELGRWARSAWPELWRWSCSARPKLLPRPRSARAPPATELHPARAPATVVLHLCCPSSVGGRAPTELAGRRSASPCKEADGVNESELVPWF